MGKLHYFKCVNENTWDLYCISIVFIRRPFIFKDIPTIKEYHDISVTHPDGQRVIHCWELFPT